MIPVLSGEALPMIVIGKAATAADLRNAAMVMDHLGKTEEQYMNGRTGSVCLEGAIRCATGRLILDERVWRADRVGMEEHDPPADRVWMEEHDPARTTAALDALIPLLPSTCDHSGHVCLESGEIIGRARVHHFNDYVCDGKDEAIAVLVEAAEKLEAEL
jgi:hypothetical protein